MPQIQTARHQLPFLAVGQAQKEITHNEALVLIDALISTAVIAELSSAPTGLTDADSGRCWLISAGSSGIWLAKTGQIACWTGGSWRYILPIEGMRIWHNALDSQVIRRGALWQESTVISAPSGGSFNDVEARAAIDAILQLLRLGGIMRP